MHPEFMLLLAKRSGQKTSQGLYYCSAEGDSRSVRVTLFLGEQDHDLVGAAIEEISKLRQVIALEVNTTTPVSEGEA